MIEFFVFLGAMIVLIAFILWVFLGMKDGAC